MKNYLIIAYLLFFHFASNSQNPVCILTPKYILDITLPFPTILHTASSINTNPKDGFDGQVTKSAQSTIVDKQIDV